MMLMYFSPNYLCFRKHTKILATQKRFLFTHKLKNSPSELEKLSS